MPVDVYVICSGKDPMSDEHNHAALERALRCLEPTVDMGASRDLFERQRRRPHRSSRRLLSAAAAVLVVGGVVGMWALSVREEPAAPMSTIGGVAETTPEDAPLGDLPLGATNVAPGVGQWLDLPAAPDGMTLGDGKAFEVSPVCDQIESAINGPTCVSISGSAQVAYSNQSLTVIEVTTVFTTETLDDYVTALVDGYPDPYQDQTVTVRGHPGRLLTGGARLITWQERPGVIGQVRIVDDSANTDLVALADSLIQRDWDALQIGD